MGGYLVEIRLEIGGVGRIFRHHIVVNRIGCFAILPTHKVVASVWCGCNLHPSLIFVFQTSGRRYCAKTIFGHGVECVTIFCKQRAECFGGICYLIVALGAGFAIFPAYELVARIGRGFDSERGVVWVFARYWRGATHVVVVRRYGYRVAFRYKVGGVRSTLCLHRVRAIDLGAAVAPTLQLVASGWYRLERNRFLVFTRSVKKFGIDSAFVLVARLNGEFVLVFCKHG